MIILWSKGDVINYDFDVQHNNLQLKLDPVHMILAEFENSMKFLWLALRFHVFSYRDRVNTTPKRQSFIPFSNSASVVWTGS